MYYKVTAKYKKDEENTTFEFIVETEDVKHTPWQMGILHLTRWKQ